MSLIYSNIACCEFLEQGIFDGPIGGKTVFATKDSNC